MVGTNPRWAKWKYLGAKLTRERRAAIKTIYIYIWTPSNEENFTWRVLPTNLRQSAERTSQNIEENRPEIGTCALFIWSDLMAGSAKYVHFGKSVFNTLFGKHKKEFKGCQLLSSFIPENYSSLDSQFSYCYHGCLIRNWPRTLPSVCVSKVSSCACC